MAERTSTENNYHAVLICSSPDSCSLVQSLEDYAFLSGEAPRLPLSGCTENCQCTYQHLDDRRHKIRREEDDGIYSFFEGPDLRLIPGRRSTDGPRQFPWTSTDQARNR